MLVQWGHALVYYDLQEKLITIRRSRRTHMAPQLHLVLGALKRDLLLVAPTSFRSAHGPGRPGRAGSYIS